jgi:hypothetical protein
VQKLPKRLTELVTAYPYGAGENDDLLPRPRFSTRRYPALYVLVETTVPKTAPLDTKSHPIHLLTDALNAPSAGEPNLTWDAIKSESVTVAELESSTQQQQQQIVLSRIFADETIRLLSLLPNPPQSTNGSSSALAVLTPSLPPVHRSPSSKTYTYTSGDATPLASSSPASRVLRTPPPPPSAFLSNSSIYTNTTDWAQFSTSGFGESPATLASTLLDKDIEVTEPQMQRRRSSRKRKDKDQSRARSRSRSRRPSVEVTGNAASRQQKEDAMVAVERTSKAVRLERVELDEAFVDFWSDAVLDPISSAFPAVVVCKLKGSATSMGLASPTSPIAAGKSLLSSTAPVAEASGQDAANSNNDKDAPVDWLIVEQKLVHPLSPAPPAQPATRSSPIPSPAPSPTFEEPASKRPRMRTGFGGGSSSSPSSPTVSGTARKRFSFFGGGSSSSNNNGGGTSFVDKAKSVAGRRSSAPSASASKMGRAMSSSAALGGSGGVKIGEMGEVIREEGPATATKATKGATAAAAAGLVGLGVGAVAAASSNVVTSTQDKDKEVEKAAAQPLPESPVSEPLAALDEAEEDKEKENEKEEVKGEEATEVPAKVEEGEEGQVPSSLLASSSSPVISQPPQSSDALPATEETLDAAVPPIVSAEATLSTDTLVPTNPQHQEPVETPADSLASPALDSEGAEVEETVVGDTTDIGSAAQHADESTPPAISSEDAGSALVVVEKDVEESVDAASSAPAEGAEEEEKLPPAPESVVHAGETPGPQLALETSEGETAAADIVEIPQGQAESNLKAEQGAEAAMDLPEVPVVDVDVPVPQPDHQETSIDEAEVAPDMNAEELVVPETEVEAEEPKVEEPVVEEPTADEPIVEELAIEEPIIEEPVVEEPIVEQPTPEEPSAEEPIVEESLAEEPSVEESVPASEEPIAEESIADEPTVEEEPAAVEPAIEEPSTEPPIVEEPATEAPVPEEPSAAEPPVVEETPAEEASISKEPAVEDVSVQELDNVEVPTFEKHEDETAETSAPSAVEEAEIAVEDTTEPSA